MPVSRGLPATLPRSESEIVVDFALPQRTSDDEMSNDSLGNEDGDVTAEGGGGGGFSHHQNLPGSSRSSSRNVLYVGDSDEETRKFKSSRRGSSELQDLDDGTGDWRLSRSEGNTSRGSEKVVTDNRRRRRSAGRTLSGGKRGPPSPTGSPGGYSFKSTIDLLPSSRKRRGLRQQV